MSDCPELFRIRLYMDRDDSTKSTDHITDRDGARKLINATLELHYGPGVNPHNGAETAQVWKITMSQLSKGGPYWWSTPGLRNNYDSEGASIYTWGYDHTLWERPVRAAGIDSMQLTT